MISSLYFVAGSSVFEVNKENIAWKLIERKVDHIFLCLAADPHKEGKLYGGTFDDGLMISDDHGETWRKAGAGIVHERILSVTVSPTEVIDGKSVVWAGTEPSGLFRSEDGGKTWTSSPTLTDLPSEPTWSFPPRPETHHVRAIQPDLHDKNRIFVGIELGGVMKSEDQGQTWEDRKPNSQLDCHSLTMTPEAKGRLYEAAGGGYAESLDRGSTWQTMNDGLPPYTYLVDLAVDPANPDIIVASAAKNARTAYQPSRASTVIVRKENNKPWQIISAGLPKPEGSSVFQLLAHASEPGVFYAVNNIGLFTSHDSGKTWGNIDVDWPESIMNKRVQGFNIV